MNLEAVIAGQYYCNDAYWVTNVGSEWMNKKNDSKMDLRYIQQVMSLQSG